MADDADEIIGWWTVRVKDWIWEYEFSAGGKVTWRDTQSSEKGVGRWALSPKCVNLRWSDSITTESWIRPLVPAKQRGWYNSTYYVGNYEAQKVDIPTATSKSSFDYKVHGIVPAIRQQGLTCWAAAGAMMMSWRKQRILSTKAAIEETGNPYIEYLKKGKGLPHSEHASFAYAAGMKCEPRRSYTPQQLCNLMLHSRSPLMILVLLPNDIMTHFYVVTRIYGDGTPYNTWIEYNDPDPDPQEGGSQTKNFQYFMEEMERAELEKVLRAQILHY